MRARRANEAAEAQANPARLVRKLQKQRQYLKQKCKRLQEQLKKQKADRVGGRIESIWFLRVALSDPKLSMQSLESFCQNFPIEETKSISTSYIGPVRDTFCILIKQISNEALAHGVSLLPSHGQNRESAPLFCCHIHDEAQMRFRSYEPLHVERLVRARSSKIQTHVVSLHQQDLFHEYYTELVPLARKDADCIGQSLIDVVSEILKTIGGSPTHIWDQLRFVHLLTSDSVATNLAAAKRLWAAFGALTRKAGLRIRYSLLFWTCASHQANLVVQTAILGRRGDEHSEAIPTNCSRWFRHLIPDYTEEFARSLFSWLDQNMVIMALADMEDVHRRAYHASRSLQELYGKDALPSCLFDIFNGGFSFPPMHFAEPGFDRHAIVSWAFQELNKQLLVCEDKPVVTRFWLFGSCVQKLWLMQALCLPASIWKTGTTVPREENARRLRGFKQFYTDPGSQRRLRIAVLDLQLTSYAVNISSQKPKPADEHNSTKPLLVRLGGQEIQTKTESLFWMVLSRLHLDPLVDVTQAFESLLLTESHILIRYNKYLEFPTRLWTLVAEYNPTGYIAAAEEFLYVGREDLDLGYSLPLQQAAWDGRTFAEALNYLISHPVQDELQGIFVYASASSLDAERRIHQARRTETNKVTTVARASRNNILQRYRSQRSLHLSEHLDMKKKMQKELYMNYRALAVRRCPSVLPRARGKLAWEQHVPQREQRRIIHDSNPEHVELLGYARVALQQEAAQRRQAAKIALSKSNEAVLPQTNQQWLDWLSEHDALFRETLRLG